MHLFLKVVQQNEVQTVSSQKAEGGQRQKCTILLKELGGKYENEYLATLWDKDAGVRFYPGDVVLATIHFSVHEHNGVMYQDILVTEILKLNN